MSSKHLDPPSDEFFRAFCNSGSLVVQCDFCKRTYFGTGGDYESGEREEYEKLAQEQPDKYIEVYDFTSFAIVDGKTYPYGCKCNGLRRYEKWFWGYRHQIIDYFSARSERELQETTQDSHNIENTKELIGELGKKERQKARAALNRQKTTGIRSIEL